MRCLSSDCLFALPEESKFSHGHWSDCVTFASGAVLLCSQECKVLQREAININIFDLMSRDSIGKQFLLLVVTSIMNISLAFVFTSDYVMKKCFSSVCRCLSFCELRVLLLARLQKSLSKHLHIFL